MATLPRRDLDDLASLVGEVDDARPDAGREAAVTGALRSLPQAVRPGTAFTEGLRATLISRAEEDGHDGRAPSAAPEPARPE